MLTFFGSKLSTLSWACCFPIAFPVPEYVKKQRQKQKNHPSVVSHQLRILYLLGRLWGKMSLFRILTAQHLLGAYVIQLHFFQPVPLNFFFSEIITPVLIDLLISNMCLSHKILSSAHYISFTRIPHRSLLSPEPSPPTTSTMNPSLVFHPQHRFLGLGLLSSSFRVQFQKESC